MTVVTTRPVSLESVFVAVSLTVSCDVACCDWVLVLIIYIIRWDVVVGTPESVRITFDMADASLAYGDSAGSSSTDFLANLRTTYGQDRVDYLKNTVLPQAISQISSLLKTIRATDKIFTQRACSSFYSNGKCAVRSSSPASCGAK